MLLSRGGNAAFRRLLLSGWVATFRGVSTFRGVTTFGGLLLLGCTSSHKKLTLISGGALLWGGGRYHDRTENAFTVSTSRCPIQSHGTTGGTYSARIFRPVMFRGVAAFRGGQYFRGVATFGMY